MSVNENKHRKNKNVNFKKSERKEKSPHWRRSSLRDGFKSSFWSGKDILQWGKRISENVVLCDTVVSGRTTPFLYHV